MQMVYTVGYRVGLSHINPWSVIDSLSRKLVYFNERKLVRVGVSRKTETGERITSNSSQV